MGGGSTASVPPTLQHLETGQPRYLSVGKRPWKTAQLSGEMYVTDFGMHSCSPSLPLQRRQEMGEESTTVSLRPGASRHAQLWWRDVVG